MQWLTQHLRKKSSGLGMEQGKLGPKQLQIAD